MGKMIATVDTTLRIPANFKNLTGKEPLVIELKAEEPTEVSDKVLEYYTKNRSHVFRREGEPEIEKPQPGKVEDLPPKFDPIQFLTERYDDIELGLESLEDPVRPKLVALCQTLKLNGFHIQKNERMKERIIIDIKAKKDQEEKIGNPIT